jgi:tetratricopeptide (TPR) repeat protein
MARASEQSNTGGQPALAELLGRYLPEQASAHAAGMAFANATGDVVPHDSVAAQPVDPRLAWDGACAAIRCLNPQADLRSWKVPVDWPSLVAGQESVTVLPFSVGNFPQMVRNLPELFDAAALTVGRTPSALVTPSNDVLAWAEDGSKRGPHPLLAAAVLRMIGQYDRAERILDRAQRTLTGEWKAALANERAALAFQRGRQDEAKANWEAEQESAPILFNRGLVALVSGRRTDAQALLRKAVAMLPESDAWHHLGRLYLALAEMRS